MQHNFDFFFMIWIFIFYFCLKQLFLNQSCLFLSVIRAFISRMNLLGRLIWLSLLLLLFVISTIIIPLCVLNPSIPFVRVFLFLRLYCLAWHKIYIWSFSAINSLRLVSFMFLWRGQIDLLLFRVNFIVGNNRSNYTTYIVLKS